MKGKVIFEETQSFVGTCIWYLVIAISVFTVGGGVFAVIFSSTPSNGGLAGISIATIAVGGVIALLATSRLSVTIDENKIYYQFPPFVSKEKYFARKDVQEMHVRNYRPIWEYGGYGYRFRLRSGRAMSIAGNVGLQLTLKNGKRVLIGSQKPDSLRTAVRRLKENWEVNG